MILRLSDKLSKRIGVKPIESLPMSANPFADWSSHVFPAARSEFILSTNTVTLYSVVFPAQGVKGEPVFRSSMFAHIRATMLEDGFEFHYKRLVDVEPNLVSYSKAFSRGVIGSMNDMVELASYMIEVQEKSPDEAARTINDTTFSVLGRTSPRRSFQRLSFREG